MEFPKYAIACTTTLDFANADQRVRHSLAQEGFGVITEIDLSATLKRKLNVDVPPYVILGACAPELARQAVLIEADIGLLLPCNVVIRETVGGTVVEALDPSEQFKLSGNEALHTVAVEVRDRLTRVISAVRDHVAHTAAPGGQPESAS